MVVVAAQNRVNRNSRYISHSIDKKMSRKCQKNFYYADILYYKTVLCKFFFWTRSKNREIENRVKQGITVYTYQKENLRNFSNVYLIT